MSSLSKTCLFVTAVTFLSLAVFPAFAQVSTIQRNLCGFFPCGGGETYLNIMAYFNTAIYSVYLLIPTLAVIYLIVAAAMYIMSTGDEEKASRAKRQIIYALGGLLLTFITWPIVWYIKGEVDASYLLGFVTYYIYLVLNLFGALATVYLIYAGYKYISSQGDEDAATTAKKQIAHAIIGLFIYGAVHILVFTVTLINVNINTIAVTAQTQLNTAIRMALLFVGTVATIYLIYAGYKYITSQGDEDASATAKRQIAYALIGIFVAGAASVLAETVITTDTTALLEKIRSAVNAVLTILSVAAVIYVIFGGVMYMSSQGDEDRSERAKMQIIYALIGVIVIALSAVLVNFIIGAVQ